MAYEALDSLHQTLTQILTRDDDLTTHRVKLDIISIRDKAVVLQFNLKAFPEKETIKKVASTTLEIIEYLFSPENLSNCGSIEPTVRVSNQLRELAEELDLIVGDVVDYCRVNDVRQQSDYPTVSSSSSRSAPASKDAVVGINEDPTVSMEPILKLSHRLRRFAEKILSSPRDLADYSRSNDDSVNSVRRLNDSPRSAPTSNDVVVGLDRDIGAIKERLCQEANELQILPIVGTGGIGKTTLARNVYHDSLIIGRFDIRAWVTVSQDYSFGDIFSSLLVSMKDFVKGEIFGLNNQEKAEKVRQTLIGRRYLIVVDDMWSTKSWDEVRIYFPDHSSGSRIMLTTRLEDVAAYADSLEHVHKMQFLDADQSWHLFQRNVFADQTCPLELQSVAKKIVRSCGGLPLSIVKIAGLLSRIGRTPKIWEQIGATDGDGQSESIFSVSYHHLPDHLKACFLYMAGFPENYEIRVSELIKLWVAECFLTERPYGSNSLEEEAEACLEDLIEKNLVLVSSRKGNGKIKSCRLHNMVRDFCVRQAGQEKFLLPVMDYLPSPILRRHFLPQVLKNHRRISASWYDLDLRDSTYSSYTHSIICNLQKGYRPKGSVQNFSLLKVLHVLRRNDHSYWELGQVFDLIHLTYLASNIPGSIVPPAISKLQNLQTLIIYRYGVRLPVQIWRMQRLRHLIAFFFDPLPHPEAAVPLENLQTLSLANNFVCSERIVEMIPNVKKLGICYSGVEFDEDCHLENLKCLDHLQKLKLEVRSDFSFGPNPNPVFPKSLRKLALSGWRRPWKDLSIIGSLPNLQVLKLKNYACDGSIWETIEGTFEQLEFLLIDESNLQEWCTESSHFPKLKCLMIHRCLSLSEIPDDIGYIPTLELIEVKGCNQSLVDSAIKIQKDQEMDGNYSIQVRYANALSSSIDQQMQETQQELGNDAFHIHQKCILYDGLIVITDEMMYDICDARTSPVTNRGQSQIHSYVTRSAPCNATTPNDHTLGQSEPFIDAYNRFLQSSGERDVGIGYGVSAQYFSDIENMNVDFEEHHINAYLTILRSNPQLAGVREPRGRVAIVDTTFSANVQAIWMARHKNDDPGTIYDTNTMEDLSSDELQFLLQYVRGKQHSMDWFDCDEVIVVYNLPEHWIVCKLNLISSTIVMFDSIQHTFTKKGEEQRVVDMRPLARIVPVLLKHARFWVHRKEVPPRLTQWAVKLASVAFVQTDSHSCGPFALMFVEAILTGKIAPHEAQERISAYRRHIAHTIFRCSTTIEVPKGTPVENCFLSGGLEVKDSEPQGEFPIDVETIKPTSECTNEIIIESDVPVRTEAVNNKDMNDLVSVDEAHSNDQGPNEVCLEVFKGASAENAPPLDVEVSSGI